MQIYVKYFGYYLHRIPIISASHRRKCPNAMQKVMCNACVSNLYQMCISCKLLKTSEIYTLLHLLHLFCN